jgi:RND family efflux transporter MFP subunit
MQRSLLFGPFLFCLAAAGLIGCARSGPAAPSAGAPPPIAVDVVHAARRDLAEYALLDGQIAPSLSSALSLQQAGTVLAVNVKEGDHVRQGEVLAEIDDRVLRAQLAQNQGSFDQAAAHFTGSSLTSPINGAQVRSNLVAAREQLAQQRAALRSAEAAFRTSQSLELSNQALLRQGYLARTVYEQSHSSFIAAQQALASARAGVSSAGAAVIAAERNLGQVGVQAQDVAANRGARAQARAQVSLLRTEVDQAVLRAPFDGEVTARLLDPGAYAGPNQPILRVASIDPVYVDFDVQDDELPFLRKGTPVTFRLTGPRPRAYSGVVSTVNAVPVDGTLQYRVRLVEPNPGNSLRGGMLVSVALRKAAARNALVVPASAIGHGMDGKANLFLISGEHARLLPVEVGMTTDELAQISSGGLRAGDVVVRTRSDMLADGAPVKIVSIHPLPASSSQPPGEHK